ncbi:MAG: tetratricopeptide repeat protein [bacterium]
MYKQNIVRILLFAVLAVMMAMPSFAAATPSKTLEQARKFYDLNLDTQAIDTLQGLIKTYPTDPSVNEANYWLGRCMARQSQFDKARTAYNLVIAKAVTPEFNKLVAETYFQIGETYRSQGTYDEARKAYQNSLKRNSDDNGLNVNSQYWLAECSYQLAGDDEKLLRGAIADYRRVTIIKADDPLVPWALYSLGDIEMRLEMYNEAIADLEAVAKNVKVTDDLYAGAKLWLGMAYASRARITADPAAQNADYDKSVKYFTALQTDTRASKSSQIQAKLNLAQTLFEMKKYDDSAAAYTTVLGSLDAASRQAIEARLQYGHALYNGLKYAASADEYNNVANAANTQKMNDLAQQGFYWRGHATFQQAHNKDNSLTATAKTDLPKAIDSFQKFIAIANAENPLIPRAMLLIAFSYEDLANAGNADMRTKAVVAFNEISKKYPANSPVVAKWSDKERRDLTDINGESERGILRLTRTMPSADITALLGSLPMGNVTWNATLQVARDYYKNGKYTDALDAAKKILADNPTGDIYVQASYLAGASNQKMNNPDKAIPYYKQALDKATTPDLRAYAQRGLTLAYLDTKNYKEALASAQALDGLALPTTSTETEKVKEKAERLMYLAEAYVNNGMNDKAVDTYNRVVTECPKTDLVPLALMGAAWVTENKGDRKGAADIYRKIVENYPDDNNRVAEAFFRLGINLVETGDFTGAIAAFKNVPATHKMGAQAAYEIAWAYRKMPAKDADERTKFDALSNTQFLAVSNDFSKDPLAVDSLYRVGEYWLSDDHKKTDDAMRYLKLALDKVTEVDKTSKVAELYPIIAYKHGICALFEKQYDKAADSLAIAADLMSRTAPTSDNYSETLFWLAQALEKQGKDKAVQARLAYLNYMDKFPTGPYMIDAATGAGRSALLGKMAEAKTDLEKALDICDKYSSQNTKLGDRAKNNAPEAQYYLGQYYFDNGNYTEALNKYIVIMPNLMKSTTFEPWYSMATLQIIHCSMNLKNVQAAQNALNQLVRDSKNTESGKKAADVAEKYGLKMPEMEP